jgi:hypothetical protein
MSVSIAVFEAIAPVNVYAAETLDINTATADGLKALPGIYSGLTKTEDWCAEATDEPRAIPKPLP